MRQQLFAPRTPAAPAALVFAGACALAGAFVLPGCVSFQRTPGARFFVLRALVETAPAGATVTGSVGLLPVRLPGALDRQQLVSWTAANELRLDELRRWAEPLDEGTTRTLAEDLAALLPQDRILRAPWPAAATPRCRVAIELAVFGPQPDGEVQLAASVLLLAPHDESVLARRSFAAKRKPAASGAAPAVDAMSALVAELAKEVASAIASLPSGPGDSPTTSPAGPETPAGERP